MVLRGVFGSLLLEKVYDRAVESIDVSIIDGRSAEIANKAYEYTVKNLRAAKLDNGLSKYELLIIEEMSKQTNHPVEKLVDQSLAGRSLEANPAMRTNTEFPTLHAKAQQQFLASLREQMRDPQTQVNFLVEQFVNKEKSQYEKDFYQAVTDLGEETATNYASVLLELRLLATEPIINEYVLKQSLLHSLKGGKNIELVHIKSLRYTYPQDRGLIILADTNAHESIGLRGEKRIYPSEEVIFKRLSMIQNLLKYYGINSHLSIIAADRDLEYLFPDNNPLVDDETKDVAREVAKDYVTNLRATHPEINEIRSLTEILSNNGSLAEYERICSLAIKEAKMGGGKLVSDKILEMRVNHQFEHYTEMFGRRYTRDLARYTASHQIANLLALSALFETYKTPPILIIDGRGFETKLIGSYNSKSRSILLTRLKDPVQVIQ